MTAVSKNNEKKDLFENIPPMKALITLALPTVISQLINVIYNIADTFFVGRTGNPGMIAGVSLVLTLFMLTIPQGNCFGLGGGSLIARMLGAKKEDEISSVSAFCVWGSAGIAVVYSLLLAVFMKPILLLFGATEETWLYSVEYTQLVVILGAPFSVASLTEAHILRNTGYSKQASIGVSGGGLLNLALDPLFMFVLFPKGQEVLAAAAATLLSNFLSFCYLTFIFARVGKKNGLSVKFSDLRKVSRQSVRKVLAVGLPAGALSALFDVQAIFLNAALSACGTLQLAAMGIVQKVERIPAAFGVAISQSMIPLIAYNFTSGNRARLMACLRAALMLGLIVTAVCGISLAIFAPSLCGVFLTASGQDAQTTLLYAATFLRIRCAFPLVNFCNYYASFGMQALGDGKHTLIHALVRILIINIPVLYLLGALFGQNGYACAMEVSEALSIIVAAAFLKKALKTEPASAA